MEECIMKRSFLEDLGLEKEIIDKIMAENGKDVEALKSAKAELDIAKNTISERDKQFEELRNSVKDNAELTQKIAGLEEENKKAAVNHKAEIESLKISNAIEKSLMSYKAKTPKAVKAMLDMDNVKIDKDGNVTGVDEQVKALFEGEDTKYLFNDDKPVISGTQPGVGSEEPTEDITTMTYSQMCAYLENNPNAKL